MALALSQRNSLLPPTYQKASFSQIMMPADSNYHRFPHDFRVYHASGSCSDMRISSSADSPIIYFISTHSGWSSKPRIVLHNGPVDLSPPVAAADLHSFSSTVDVGIAGEGYSLVKEGVFNRNNTFELAIHIAGRNERFGWKNSGGADVAAMNGRSHGMKLVRSVTGQVVAAWF
ncbi:hypothetical protein BJ878DRAFT_205889 [Calycina marina]|uniref:Uncharacterized protein n=1 Tax=Calycina marina TaxID=1763456 RepID=A0A9P8CCQ3_9HELO|nr:hypothetical protein BJ878DRAFT_205889 [Calycina marina]